MTETNALVKDLAKRITASQRTYEKLARDHWDDLNVAMALRCRRMAEGYAGALDHLLAVCGEFGEVAP